MKQFNIIKNKKGRNGNVHRLICTMAEDPDNVRHLPVHRFRKAEWNGLKSKEPKGFDMDQYIEEQRIGFLLSNKPLIGFLASF